MRKIGTGQGSSSIARTIKKLQRLKIKGEDWRSFFGKILTSWRKIESMSGSWEDKFKESFTSLFIEGVKTMKDPKLKLTAEITAQMARDRYKNWDILLQRWSTILKNSEDHEVKKDQGQIQANLADRSNKECFNCGKMGHLASQPHVEYAVGSILPLHDMMQRWNLPKVAMMESRKNLSS